MPAFEPAPFEASKLVFEVAREHHRQLLRSKLAVLFASADNGKLPPIVARPTSPPS